MRIEHQLVQAHSGLQIGYSANSGWIAVSERGHWLLEGKHVWWAAPLLESEPGEMVRRIAEICALDQATRPFPLPELLRFAFLSHSSYWADKAAEWYPYLPDEDRCQLSTALKEVSQGKWASQKTRQFAEREARKLKP